MSEEKAIDAWAVFDPENDIDECGISLDSKTKAIDLWLAADPLAEDQELLWPHWEQVGFTVRKIKITWEVEE